MMKATSTYFVHFEWTSLVGEKKPAWAFLKTEAEVITEAEICGWQEQLTERGYDEPIIDNYILSETVFEEEQNDSHI